MPSCGSHATIPFSDGSSIRCKFANVSQPQITVVAIGIAGPGGAATSSLEVTVLPDAAPPLLSLPQNVAADSTSNAGRVVSFTATATDAVSGSAAVTCMPQSGAQFPIGTTTVSCSASDWVPNVATGTFTVTIVDRTPPTLVLPQPFTLNATAPSGAIGTYQVTASDAPRPQPSIQCAPRSGSTFPIGTTNVVCTATDAAGNTAQGQFAITVRSVADQIVAALRTYLQAQKLDGALLKRLLEFLSAVAKALDSNRNTACLQVTGIEVIVKSAGRSSPRRKWRGSRRTSPRIRTVLGCGRN